MKKLVIAIGISLLSTTLWADVPNTFSAGQRARASEVNENFEDLDSRVSAMESAVAAVVDYLSVYYATDTTYTYEDVTDNNDTCDRFDRVLTAPTDTTYVLRERMYTAADSTNCSVEDYFMEIQGDNLVATHIDIYNPADAITVIETITFTPSRVISALTAPVGKLTVETSALALAISGFNFYGTYETGFVQGPINESVLGTDYSNCFVYRRIESLGSYQGGTNAFYATHCPGIGITEFVSPFTEDKPVAGDKGKYFKLISVTP
jgi:hypothetical protein